MTPASRRPKKRPKSLTSPVTRCVASDAIAALRMGWSLSGNATPAGSGASDSGTIRVCARRSWSRASHHRLGAPWIHELQVGVAFLTDRGPRPAPLAVRHDQPARSGRLPCRPRLALALIAACLFPTPAVAHPGSGIVVDRRGQIYFVDTGAGVWKIDAHGTLTRVPGPAFHWMTIDADDRFGNARLSSGPNWEITRAGANPTLILASDFPIAASCPKDLTGREDSHHRHRRSALAGRPSVPASSRPRPARDTLTTPKAADGSHPV